MAASCVYNTGSVGRSAIASRIALLSLCEVAQLRGGQGGGDMIGGAVRLVAAPPSNIPPTQPRDSPGSTPACRANCATSASSGRTLLCQTAQPTIRTPHRQQERRRAQRRHGGWQRLWFRPGCCRRHDAQQQPEDDGRCRDLKQKEIAHKLGADSGHAGRQPATFKAVITRKPMRRESLRSVNCCQPCRKMSQTRPIKRSVATTP